MTRPFIQKPEAFQHPTSGSVNSSACYMVGTSAVPYPFGIPPSFAGTLSISQPNILTDVQQKAFMRTMKKHKDGLDLLAE
ncbi:MAG: hypothetical protein IJB12_03790 [Methanocorpusculum sp.]|nr:hypothetical protein [Methanocorpusculum sp.]MBQ4597501.1 hypothetical protein [Methanocorpusculum sp.]